MYIKLARAEVFIKMKNCILLLGVTLVMGSCSITSSSTDEGIGGGTSGEVKINENTETVIDLGKNNVVSNQVTEKYFYNVSEFPTRQVDGEADREDNIYWIRSNGFPVRGGKYFSSDGLVYAEYDADTDQIEVANILNEGSMIKNTRLEEDLYVSWTYDFKDEELRDFVQVTPQDESQDLIDFSEEEWADLSCGYKENLLEMLK